MITIEPSTPGYREIQMLAAAWKISAVEVVSRLVDHYLLTGHREWSDLADTDVAVHRRYAGHPIEGIYHRDTRGVTITSEPLAGTTYPTPSAASAAVITAINPYISPNRSGWHFWIVTATGKTLHSIRYQR